MKKTIIGLSLLAASFGAGVYVGDKAQPVTGQENRMKYASMSAENGSPNQFLSFRDSIYVNENNRVELYFGSDSTGVFRKVNADGTVGTFGSKVDEWWESQKSSIKSYFKNE